MKTDRTVTTEIDPEKCIGCGLCIPVCPKETISLEDGKARVTGTESLNCGHCAAACPEGAITVGMLDPLLAQFETFTAHSVSRNGALARAQSATVLQFYHVSLARPPLSHDLSTIFAYKRWGG